MTTQLRKGDAVLLKGRRNVCIIKDFYLSDDGEHLCIFVREYDGLKKSFGHYTMASNIIAVVGKENARYLKPFLGLYR